MPHPIFGYMLLELVIGALGMAMASRKVDTTTRSQRWLKYATYILIVGLVLASIFLGYFRAMACLIVSIGAFEVGRATLSVTHLSTKRLFWVLLIYGWVAAGFIGFSGFDTSFLLFIYFQVFTFDGFSQITGQLLGKHSLVPTISPGKTREGLLGGLLFTLCAAVLAHHWIQISVLQALLFGFFTSVFALAGDVLASYLKRLACIKDYSQLLPGHGGILDRFDSLLFAGACYYMLRFVIRF